MSADRDVADELTVDGLLEEAVKFLAVLLVAGAVVALAEVEVPVAQDPRRPAGHHGQMATGREQTHAGEQRAVGEQVLEGEVFEQVPGLMRTRKFGCSRKLFTSDPNSSASPTAA